MYRVFVGIVGLGIVVVGIVALPAPGPGWVIIFIGLGVLATEFHSARRVLAYTRRRYEAWVVWLARQSNPIRLLVSLALLLLVAVCTWLVGAWALVAGWVGIEWGWLEPPFGGL